MRFGFTSILLFACRGDHIIEKKANIEPSIMIASHSDGASVPEGIPVEFWATVSDDDHDWDELLITWYVGSREVCPSTVADLAGESICNITFQPGDTNVIAEVRDPYNAAGRDEISIILAENEPPEVEITAPATNTSHPSGQTLQFVATVSDTEDPVSALSISWSSSIEGTLGLSTTPDSTGRISDYLELSPGEHIIALQVTDTMGAIATDDILITIEEPNTPPTCAITAPASGSSYALGDAISIQGYMIDAETATNALSYTWTSSWDGDLGQGTADSGGNLNLNTTSLSANNHDIILEITDSGGAICSDTISLLIGNPPSVSNVQIQGTPYNDQTLTCVATVTDPDDSPTVSYTWSSGTTILGTGDTIDLSGTALLPSDPLTCTVEAVDSLGATAQDSDTVTIANRTPSVSGVQIQGSPYNDQTLTCVGTVSDADSTPSLSYAWTSGGVALGASSTLNLANTALMPGDSLTCTMTATDNIGDTAQDSDTISIDNRTPLAPTVNISWSGTNSSPEEGDSLTCTGSGSSDIDGQSVSYSYAWSSSNGALSSAQTISGAQTFSGDTWTCTVTASDGSLSASASDSVLVTGCAFLTTFDTISLGGSQSLEIVKICAGTFSMGSPANEEGRDSDETLHTVSLTNDFYAMTTEVTQGMFAQLMGYNSHTGLSTTGTNGSYGVGSDYPAYYVDWHMAADFANAVTEQHNSLYGTNLQACYSCSGVETAVTCSQAVDPYSCDGYRLLTEAEWEYAARGGTNTAFWTASGGGNIPAGSSGTAGCTASLILSDGTLLDDISWFCGNNLNYNSSADYGAKEVGTKADNDYGLWDMHGNVDEWVHDKYGSYSSGSVTDPVNTSGSNGILRSGAWGGPPYSIRSADRFSYGQGTRNQWSYGIGFRIGRTIF